MNKKPFFVLIIFNYYNPILFTSPLSKFEWPIQPYKQANIVIILDRENQKTTKSGIDSTQMDFKSAIAESNIPILVSGAILQNYLNSNEAAQELMQIDKTWQEQIQIQNLTSKQKEEFTEIMEKTIESNLDKIFNYRKYEFYKSQKSDLYLFLPIECKYKNAFNLKKFDKIPKGKLIQTTSESTIRINYPREKFYTIDNWLEGIEDIFEKKKPNLKEKILEKAKKEIATVWSEENTYWWNIILHGHGSPPTKEKETIVKYQKKYNIQLGLAQEEIQSGTKFTIGYIAGLREDDFSKLIYFLDKPDLNVFFFYYGTCYGSGYRRIKPYLEKAIQEIRPLTFTIVSGATQDLQTYQKDINYNKLFGNLNVLLNYSYLMHKKEEKLKRVFTKERDPWDVILKNLTPSIIKTQLKSDFPLIKFAGTTYFQAIYKEPKIKTITKALVEKHKFKIDRRSNCKRIINEKSTIKVPPSIKLLLIFPNVIDVQIDIKGNEFPEFASLDPIINLHFFEKINFDNLNFEKSIKKLAEKFGKKDESKTIKLFAIKRIMDETGIKKNILFDNKYNVYKTKEDVIKAIYFLQDQINLYFRPTINIKPGTAIEELIAKTSKLQPITPFLLKLREKTQHLINYIIEKFEIDLSEFSAIAAKQLIKQINLYMPHNKEINSNIQNLQKAYNLLKNQEKIDLSNLKITDETIAPIIKNVVEINKFIKIKKIDLSNNELAKFPRDLIKLEELNEINLPNNKIQIVPLELDNLKNLKILNLNRNLKDILVSKNCLNKNLRIEGKIKILPTDEFIKKKKKFAQELVQKTEKQTMADFLKKIKLENIEEEIELELYKIKKSPITAKNKTLWILNLFLNIDFELFKLMTENKNSLEKKYGINLNINNIENTNKSLLQLIIEKGDLNNNNLVKKLKRLING